MTHCVEGSSTCRTSSIARRCIADATTTLGAASASSERRPDAVSNGDNGTAAAPSFAHAQYVATAGLRAAGASVSGTVRYRTFNSRWYLTPAARVSYQRGIVSATAYAEQQESDSTFRGDVSASIRVLPFLSIGGSLGQTRPIEGNERPTTLGYRGWITNPGRTHR